MDHGGYYEVRYSTTQGGPYDQLGCQTADKTATGCTVSGLSNGSTYYFVVQTFTPAHAVQQNDLTSAASAEVKQTISMCVNVSSIPQSECEALAALYTSTGGDSWTNNSGWLVSNDPCTWYGVTCDGGHVTELVVEGNNLNGSLPPELGNLSRLTILRLAVNNLTGSIPGSFGNLDSLVELWLGKNALNQQIPLELTTLPALENLVLWHNAFSGPIPPELGTLSTLRMLGLSFNSFSGQIPPELANLDNLWYLDLWDNDLEGPIPPELGSMLSLSYLYLADNNLSGPIPAELGNLTTLEQLLLNDNKLSGTLPDNLFNPEGAGASFYFLHLQNNQFSGEIPESIVNLTSLGIDSLNLGYNMLESSSANVLNFLASVNSDWADTQTVPPSNAQVDSVSSNSATLSWTPITYIGDGGYYQVIYGTNSGGPYDQIGCQTADKTEPICTVNGLNSRHNLLLRRANLHARTQ